MISSMQLVNKAPTRRRKAMDKRFAEIIKAAIKAAVPVAIALVDYLTK